MKLKLKRKSKKVTESFGMSVEEYFKQFATKQVGRRKVLDRELMDTFVTGLSEFLAKRYRKMTPEEFVNLPIGDRSDNMLTEFANWLKKNKGVDLYENFDDYYLRDRVGDDAGTMEIDGPETSEMNGKTRWTESDRDEIKVIPGEDGTTTLARRCPFCHKEHSIEIPMDRLDYYDAEYAWMSGAMIQDAFPYLDADQREFIKTGICPKCWGGEDDEMIDEGSGSKVIDEYGIGDYLFDSVKDCEWVEDVDYIDAEPGFTVKTTDGDEYDVLVQKMVDRINESEEGGVSLKTKQELIELIQVYGNEMELRAKGDKTAGSAAGIAYRHIMDIIGEL